MGRLKGAAEAAEDTHPTEEFIAPGHMTPAIRAALAALRAVPDAVADVCAAALAPVFARRAERKFGPAQQPSFDQEWLRRRRDPFPGFCMPADDHLEFREQNGCRSRISQPYGIGWEDLRALVQQCEREGLTCRIDAASPHFPGRTLQIVVQVAGTAAE
jgi:hypothetical protein